MAGLAEQGVTGIKIWKTSKTEEEEGDEEGETGQKSKIRSFCI